MPAAVDLWLRTLQQALQLEAQQGFSNLQGRYQLFSAFMTASLAAPPAELGPGTSPTLEPLLAAFAD